MKERVRSVGCAVPSFRLSGCPHCSPLTSLCRPASHQLLILSHIKKGLGAPLSFHTPCCSPSPHVELFRAAAHRFCLQSFHAANLLTCGFLPSLPFKMPSVKVISWHLYFCNAQVTQQGPEPIWPWRTRCLGFWQTWDKCSVYSRQLVNMCPFGPHVSIFKLFLEHSPYTILY